MRKLLNDIERFQRALLQSQSRAYAHLLCGRSPATLFITCSDLSANPCLLAQCSAGDLVVVRSVGNVVTPYDLAQSDEGATIEYAVGVLKVSNVIICGHTACGVVRSYVLKNGQTNGEAGCSDVNTEIRQATESNVRVQLTNLRTHPAVVVAEERSKLAVHGWVYEDETGQVSAYEPYEDCFERIVRKYAA